jgi:hypothetical protein
MVKIANRLLASVLAIIGLIFGARAMAIFWVLSHSPQNFLPVPKAPDGCSVCPPQIFLSWETEQILTILGSLIVLAMARMLWHRPPIPHTET